jgi:hypothetical protein
MLILCKLYKIPVRREKHFMGTAYWRKCYFPRLPKKTRISNTRDKATSESDIEAQNNKHHLQAANNQC